VGAQVGKDLIEGFAAVDVWFSCAEQVQIGPVQDENRGHHPNLADPADAAGWVSTRRAQPMPEEFNDAMKAGREHESNRKA
jgi:hypothetical protein